MKNSKAYSTPETVSSDHQKVTAKFKLSLRANQPETAVI